MIISILFACSILAVSILVWLFRQRFAQHLPSKETMSTVALVALVALLLVMAILPDIILLCGTLYLMPHAFKIVLGLAAAAMLCVGCSKQSPEPVKPAVIHWKGQDGGYEDTTDRAARQGRRQSAVTHRRADAQYPSVAIPSDRRFLLSLFLLPHLGPTMRPTAILLIVLAAASSAILSYPAAQLTRITRARRSPLERPHYRKIGAAVGLETLHVQVADIL